MKKLFITDYDGTLYINDEDIKNNLVLISKFMRKNIFVIATGRSYLDFIRKQMQYNIKYHYLVINHGATIIYGDHVINNICIDEFYKNEIINYLNKQKYDSIFLCSGLDSRVESTCNDITKIHVEYDSNDKTLKVYNYLLETYSNKINCYLMSNCNSIEIVAKSSNKANAAEFIKNKERIKDKKIYTVGNGVTDIAMIKNYNGYAMINSEESVKKTCGNYISSVSELLKKVL